MFASRSPRRPHLVKASPTTLAPATTWRPSPAHPSRDLPIRQRLQLKLHTSYLCTNALKLDEEAQKARQSGLDMLQQMIKQKSAVSKSATERTRFNQRSPESNTAHSSNYVDFVWLSNKHDHLGVIRLLDSLIAAKKPIFKVDLDIATKAAQNLGDCETLKRVLQLRQTHGFSTPHAPLYSLVQLAGAQLAPEYLQFALSFVKDIPQKTALLNLLFKTWLFVFKSYSEANRILATFKSMSVKMDEWTFKYWLQGAPSKHEQSRAWDEMKAANVKPTLEHFEIVFNALVRTGEAKMLTPLLAELFATQSQETLASFKTLPHSAAVSSLIASILLLSATGGVSTIKTVLETLEQQGWILTVDQLLVVASASVEDARLATILYGQLLRFYDHPVTQPLRSQVSDVIINQFFRRFIVAWEKSQDWSPVVLAMVDIVRTWRSTHTLPLPLVHDLIRWSLDQSKDSVLHELLVDLQQRQALDYFAMLPIGIHRIQTQGPTALFDVMATWQSLVPEGPLEGAQTLYAAAFARTLPQGQDSLELTKKLYTHAKDSRVSLPLGLYQRLQAFFAIHGLPDLAEHAAKVLVTSATPDAYLVEVMKSVSSFRWLQLLWEENLLLGGGRTALQCNEYLANALVANAPLEYLEKTLQAEGHEIDDSTWTTLLEVAADSKPAAALIIFDQWMPRYGATKTQYHHSLLYKNSKIPAQDRRRIRREADTSGLGSQQSTNSKIAELKQATSLVETMEICQKLSLEGNVSLAWEYALRSAGHFRATREEYHAIVVLMQSAGVRISAHYIKVIWQQIAANGGSEEDLAFWADFGQANSAAVSSQTLHIQMALAALHREDFDRAAQILRFPLWKNCPPAEYYAVKGKLAARTNDVEVWRIGEEMRAKGLVPDAHFYQNIASGFIEAGDFDKAIETLHHLREKEGITAGISFYDQLMKHLAKDSTKAMKLIEEMKVDNYTMNNRQLEGVVFYSALGPNASEEALIWVYNWMRDNGKQQFSERAVGLLMKGLAKFQKQDLLRQLLASLEVSNQHTPTEEPSEAGK